MRIVEADVDALDRAREDRAALPGIVADADDEIDVFVHHGFNVLGVQAFSRQAGQLERLNGPQANGYQGC